MYTSHFGLTKLPFENVPDPVFFFDEGDYSRVYRRVTGSLIVGRGLMIVTGPIGSGKTTLGNMITSALNKELRIIWLAEPPKNSLDLFLFIAQELGVQPSTSERVFFLRDIRRALIEINNRGIRCLLMIDESHVMQEDTLRGVLLLNNLEEGSKKLLQILLLGQEEIMLKIDKPDMSSFKQRISTLEHIGKLNREQMRKYISYRLQVAGGHPSLFTDTAWEALILASATGGGIPRVINSLCERTLNVAYERDHKVVDLDDVSTVAEEMNIDREVFHYKLALRNMDSMEPGRSPTDNTGLGQSPAEQNGTMMNPDMADATQERPGGGPVLSARQPQTETAEARHATTHKPAKNPARNPGAADRRVDSTVDRRVDSTVDRRTDSNEKGLVVPLVFLSLSIVTLLSSIYFYCGKHSISEPITCLQELIGL